MRSTIDTIQSEFMKKAAANGIVVSERAALLLDKVADQMKQSTVDLIQSEFMQKAAASGIVLSAATRKKLKNLKNKVKSKGKQAPAKTKSLGRSFIQEKGDEEVSNPDRRSKKRTVKIKSLKSGKPGSIQRRTYERLYQQWLKSKGADTKKPSAEKSKIQEKIQEKAEKLKKQPKSKTDQKLDKLRKQIIEKRKQSEKEKPQTQLEKPVEPEKLQQIEKKEPEIQLEKPAESELDKVDAETTKIIVEEKVDKKEYAKEVEVAKQKQQDNVASERFKNTINTIRANENKLPISVAFLPDPPAPTKVKDDMVRQHTDGINSSLKALKVEADVVDWSDSPNVLTYEVKIKADPADENYIKYHDRLKSRKLGGVIGSVVRQEGVTVTEDQQRGVFRISIPKGKKIGEGREPVFAKELLASPIYSEKARNINKLPCAIGKDTNNNTFNIDFGDSGTPHLLISGTSGSGKSVLINGMVCSDLVSKKSDEVKMIFIDAKKAGAEFGSYDNIAHLAMPVVKDMKQVLPTLNKISRETLRRYKMFAGIKVGGVAIKDIKSFNNLVTKDPSIMNDDERTAYESIPETDRKKMPALKVYIDEAAALLKDKSFGKAARHEIDETLKIARAAGVHLILASQSPDKSSIDGDLQQNLGSKIMLRLTDQADADGAGIPEATGLLDNGDGIFQDANGKKRIQSAYINDPDIAKIVKQAEGKQEFIQFEKPKTTIVDEPTSDANEIFKAHRDNLKAIRDKLEQRREQIESTFKDSEQVQTQLQDRVRQLKERLREQELTQEDLSKVDTARQKRIKQQEEAAKRDNEESFEPAVSTLPDVEDIGLSEPESETTENLPEDKVRKEIDELTSGKPVAPQEVKNKPIVTEEVKDKKNSLKDVLDRIKKGIFKKKTVE